MAYLKNIDREARGNMIILSRSSPQLVEKLFESEVPEIYEGIVSVVGVAREAGSRSKIAVTSRVRTWMRWALAWASRARGCKRSCKNSAVRRSTSSPTTRDPARYIINAIQPAEVNKVIVDEADHRMELVVPDEKLSLAIGRKGQNVRLAAQLTGWKLDIISESKFKQIEEDSLGALREIEGVSEDMARAFYRLGFRALEEVAEATDEELTFVDGVKTAEQASLLRINAESAMERLRVERIRTASSGTAPLTEREKLRFVAGIGMRTLQLLEESNYKNVRDVAEEDPERLAVRSGLGAKKARQVQEAARHFLDHELPEIARARATAAARLEAAPDDGSSAAGEPADRRGACGEGPYLRLVPEGR